MDYPGLQGSNAMPSVFDSNNVLDLGLECHWQAQRFIRPSFALGYSNRANADWPRAGLVPAQ